MPLKFKNQIAWFSDSVDISFIKLWRKNGGLVGPSKYSSYFFTKDIKSFDTKSLLKKKKLLLDPVYISQCLESENPVQVSPYAFNNYKSISEINELPKINNLNYQENDSFELGLKPSVSSDSIYFVVDTKFESNNLNGMFFLPCPKQKFPNLFSSQNKIFVPQRVNLEKNMNFQVYKVSRCQDLLDTEKNLNPSQKSIFPTVLDICDEENIIIKKKCLESNDDKKKDYKNEKDLKQEQETMKENYNFCLKTSKIHNLKQIEKGTSKSDEVNKKKAIIKLENFEKNEHKKRLMKQNTVDSNIENKKEIQDLNKNIDKEKVKRYEELAKLNLYFKKLSKEKQKNEEKTLTFTHSLDKKKHEEQNKEVKRKENKNKKKLEIIKTKGGVIQKIKQIKVEEKAKKYKKKHIVNNIGFFDETFKTTDMPIEAKIKNNEKTKKGEFCAEKRDQTPLDTNNNVVDIYKKTLNLMHKMNHEQKKDNRVIKEELKKNNEIENRKKKGNREELQESTFLYYNNNFEDNENKTSNENETNKKDEEKINVEICTQEDIEKKKKVDDHKKRRAIEVLKKKYQDEESEEEKTKRFITTNHQYLANKNNLDYKLNNKENFDFYNIKELKPISFEKEKKVEDLTKQKNIQTEETEEFSNLFYNAESDNKSCRVS